MKLNDLRLHQALILIIVAYYSSYFLRATKLFGNTASRVLLAVGPMLGLGSPYKDLYEIVPPGYLVFLTMWMRLFGMGMVSFIAIHILLVFMSGFFLLLIYEELFKDRFLRILLFFSTVVVLNSFLIQSDLFTIDFFAGTFVLGGLAVLLRVKKLLWSISIAATLFFLASQFKDIYIVSFISLLPFYIRELLKKNKKNFARLVLISSIGPLTILIVIISYLYFNNVFIDYLNIVFDKAGFTRTLSLKGIFFSYIHIIGLINQFFLKLPNIISVLLLINLIIFLVPLVRKRRIKSVKYRSPTKLFIRELTNYGETDRGKIILTVNFIVWVLFGTIIYGLYAGSQIIIIIACMFIVIGLLLIHPLSLLKESKIGYFAGLTLFFILLVLVPIISIISHPYYPVKRNHTFNLEAEIMRKVDKKSCILHVYGWEVAASYIYTQRRPCSKYFLANELYNLKKPGLFDEYRQDLINNPAAALIYSEGGADIDIQSFENEIINVRKVLEMCYIPDHKFIDYKLHFFAPVTLYWPKPHLNKDQLKKCWQDNSAPKL